MELLFFVDLLAILHFESCHEYIMNFIFVTLLADDLDVVGYVPGIRLFRLKFTRVRVARTSSPSRTFCKPAHLSAFLFSSFSNAYENNI